MNNSELLRRVRLLTPPNMEDVLERYRLTEWDYIGLQEAKLASTRSKDPSTGVGCYICDAEKRMVSKGWNGFPSGIHDYAFRYEDRALKYKLIIHAEKNAISQAEGRRLVGSTLYSWPIPPCSQCTGYALQHGVARIVGCWDIPSDSRARWDEDIALSALLAEEKGVLYCAVEGLDVLL